MSSEEKIPHPNLLPEEEGTGKEQEPLFLNRGNFRRETTILSLYNLLHQEGEVLLPDI